MAWGFPAYDPGPAKGSGISRTPGTEGFAPPGWPREVRPPGAPGWERSAAEWLLDLCPADWRGYPGLRRHLVVLARFALMHVEAGQTAAARGLSETRADLRDVADLDVIEAAVQTWQLEQARLVGLRRAVGLVEEAIRGRRFTARL
jgi:hypothetical protein